MINFPLLWVNGSVVVHLKKKENYYFNLLLSPPSNGRYVEIFYIYRKV